MAVGDGNEGWAETGHLGPEDGRLRRRRNLLSDLLERVTQQLLARTAFGKNGGSGRQAEQRSSRPQMPP